MINPREIENVLLGVRGVAAAVVIGELDQAMGEVPVAYLQAGPDGLDATAIFAACRRLAARGEVPVALYRVDEIPRARAGRVARRALRGGPTPSWSPCWPVREQPEGTDHALTPIEPDRGDLRWRTNRSTWPT